MFSSKKFVILFDMDSVQDDDNGDRTINVVNAIKTIGDKQLVGVNTQTLAQMQNMNFSWSIVIDKMFYHDQKYLFIDGKIFVINNVAPAKNMKDCRLNVSDFKDESIEKAVKEWFIDDLQ